MSASFVDPFLVIIRDDSSILLLRIDESGDLDEVSLSESISNSKWSSACLYHDKQQVFGPPPSTPNASSKDNAVMFLLSEDRKLSVSHPSSTRLTESNEIQIYDLTGMNLLSVIDGVDCSRPILSSEPPRRSNNREALTEILVADLGDRWVTSPYLIVCFLPLSLI